MTIYVNEHFGVYFQDLVYALDVATIDLCLSVFPWATFRQTKAAVKLDTLLDLRGNIVTFILISKRLHLSTKLTIFQIYPHPTFDFKTVTGVFP